MNKTYKKHVFVCENKRNSPAEKSCGNAGSKFRMLLKNEIINKKLNNEIRINRSGCLGKCSLGPCFVIYPEGKWHFNVTPDEYQEFIDKLISD